jgi:hypothetical protein
VVQVEPDLRMIAIIIHNKSLTPDPSPKERGVYRLYPYGEGSGTSFLFVKQFFFYSHYNLVEVVAYLFVLEANNCVAFTL